MFIEGIFSLTIAGEGRSRDIDLLGNRGEHDSGNLFDFHKGATRKLQEGQLDSEPQAVGRGSSTINKVSLFFGKRVVSGNVTIREVRGNLGQCMTLLWVEIHRDLVISRHGRCFSSFALVVAYSLLARQSSCLG